MKLTMDNMVQRGSKTSWGLAGMGLVITGVGKAVGGTLGAGLIGFGMAHMVMGLADIFKDAAGN